MRDRSVLTEARQIQLASELIILGAKLQVLEVNTDLSCERLIKLYKEISGVSPPKGMLPYSEDWFINWQPNMYSILFIHIHNYITTNTKVDRIDALIKDYQLYLEHIKLRCRKF